jgi:hypothetical protein
MAKTTGRTSATGPTPSEARRAFVSDIRAALKDVHRKVDAAATREAEAADETTKVLRSREVKRAERGDPAVAAGSKATARAARARREQARELKELAKAVDDVIAKDLDELSRTLLG